MVYLCNTILFTKEILKYEIYMCIYDLETIILTNVIQTKKTDIMVSSHCWIVTYFVAVSVQLNQFQWESP